MRIYDSLRVALLRARLFQIRKCSGLFSTLQTYPKIASIIRAARSLPFSRKIMDAVAGYRRVFDSLSEAGDVAARYVDATHGCIANINREMANERLARPSDYPVLFYMDRLLTEVSTLYDLGGNVGTLLYCYQKYLKLPQDLAWFVYDVAPTRDFGRQLARERGEHRLRFTDDLAGIEGSDILLVTGSLHYFEFSLPDRLRGLAEKPKHVFINRTPMAPAKSVVTVQDADTYLVACRIISRRDLIAGMEEVGYELVDQWSVPELWVRIPFYPEYSVHEYTGLYFRLGTAAARTR